MTNIINESSYSGYMFKDPKTNWTSTTQLKEKLTFVEFDNKSINTAGGIPVISDGKKAFVDTSDNHCVIYGASGFKKSICVFMPLIGSLSSAGESMVILDPKGELYTRTAALLKSRGYKIIVLNFRDFNGDGYNPLHYPAKLWRNVGETDKAASVANVFGCALAQRQENHRNVDPIWPDTAKAYINGVLPMMFDSYKNIDDINLLALADYFTERSADYLKEFVNESKINNTAITNIKTVLSEPEKTRMSTLSTCSSFIQPFIQNDKLARMLSHSTFELEDIAQEKTALYIITDDTTTACNPIVGVLISQLQTILVDKAFHSESGRLNNRVNFILDEFCSFPIPGIGEALATHRSRNIKYYLCIQSIDALSDRYPHYESLLANCATVLFLGSTEMKLLEMISTRCGETEINYSGTKEPLISIPELMTLRKSWDSKEALYLNLAESVRYCTNLPAIEQYESFTRFGKSDLPNITHPKVNVYTFNELLRDISIDEAKYPFSEPSKITNKKKKKRKETQENVFLSEDIQKELDIKFEELFGVTSEED